MQYIPGSHRWPLLPVTGLAGDMDAIRTVLTEEQLRQFQPMAIELKKGECTFHHPLMVHGSYENSTGRPAPRGGDQRLSRRRLLRCRRPNCWPAFPRFRADKRWTARSFPLLYDPAQ